MKNWFVALLCLGTFVLGYFVRTKTDSADQPIAEPRSVTRSNRSNAESESPKAVTWDRAELRKIVSGEVASIDDSDLRSVVESLAASAGLTGLTSGEKDRLNALLAQWYGVDPEGVVDWLGGLERFEDQYFFYGHLSDSLSDEHALEMLALTEDFLKNASDDQISPFQIANRIALLGTEPFARLFEATINGRGSGSSGSAGKYPEDFDFHGVLEHFRTTLKNAPKGEVMRQLPADLLGKWAEKDIDGAYAWYAEMRDADDLNLVPFNSSFNEILESYAKTASAEEVAAFVASEFQSQEPTEAVIRRTFQSLSDRVEIEDFLTKISDPTLRSELPGKLLDASRGHSGGQYERSRRALFSYLSPVEQSRYLESLDRYDREIFESEAEKDSE